MARSQTAIRRDLVRTAADLRKAETLGAKRNRLWQEAIDAGFTAAEIGEIFDLEAQTVRWNLNRMADDAPDLRKAMRRRTPASA